MKVGFIGLGRMGGHMCSNVIKAGFETYVSDLVPALVEQKVAEGAIGCKDNLEVAANMDIGFTMLPNGAIVEAVMCGPKGVLAHCKPGTIIVDMSSVAPGTTQKMAKIAAEHGVKYIVFSSTAATYGEPERVPILETDPTHPTNCYGDTKLAMERMFYWASVAHGIHFVALRYFNACGAHMSGKIGEAHNPETHLIPIILQVPNGRRDHVSIYGDDYPTRDGTCVRDYIHVTDLASAHILAAEYLMNGGENNVFNLGNGVGFTVKEIIDTAEKVVGKPIKCEMAPRRAGDPAQLVASSEKAKTVLGWKPKYDDIETIIGSAWNWHKEHPHGYDD